MNNTPTILAIDSSSVMLGYCLYNGAVLASGEIALKDPDIAVRCRLAYAQLNGLLEMYPGVDCIALEAPVALIAKAVIPQARVSGALMVAATLQGLLVLEIAVPHVKQALTGKGNAKKALMMATAWERYGVRGEHASDALGVAIAASKKITVEHVKEAA